ncbi:hypothetical protein HY250_00140 [Candidatus Azambacteria bacterium]|nr:hypothetical protein [Candidatus Azambacteria bacterium]MBI3684808.1 hypothetical protein [Candidatus Azambacteria bacterium]
MSFLVKGDFFKDYSRAVVFVVYTDNIVAMVVKKEGDRVVVVERGSEKQESEVSEGDFAAEKIILNCEKALQALSKESKSGAKDFIVALSGGTGMFSFAQAKGIRQDKEKKITKEEVEAVTSKWYGKENEASASEFRNIPQRFWVDGFAVPDAVGLNGKEVTADIVSIACGKSLVRAFDEFASALGMRCAGMTDVRCALAEWKTVFTGNDSAILAAIFENETDIIVVRAKKIAGIGVVRAGYGILIEELARAHAVGKEEARSMLDAFRGGALNAWIAEKIKETIVAAARNIAQGVVTAISQIDKTNLLPGNVWVVASEYAPEAYDALRDETWLAGLPLERNPRTQRAEQSSYDGNVRVRIVADDKRERRETVFDDCILEYLSS